MLCFNHVWILVVDPVEGLLHRQHQARKEQKNGGFLRAYYIHATSEADTIGERRTVDLPEEVTSSGLLGERAGFSSISLALL